MLKHREEGALTDENMCFLSLIFLAKFCLKAVLLLTNSNGYKPVVAENFR